MLITMSFCNLIGIVTVSSANNKKNTLTDDLPNNKSFLRVRFEENKDLLMQLYSFRKSKYGNVS